MVLVRGLHNTTKENLQGILKTGLEPRVPSEHHWPFYYNQPKGIYISPVGQDELWYLPGDERKVPVLRVHYCGPMKPDKEMLNHCFVCLLPIPRNMIKLVVEDPLG